MEQKNLERAARLSCMFHNRAGISLPDYDKSDLLRQNKNLQKSIDNFENIYYTSKAVKLMRRIMGS